MKRNLITVILAAILVAGVAVGGTLAYMTDSATLTNKFLVGDLDIDFEEPDYPKDCIEKEKHEPTDSYPKNPTVTAVIGKSYMRIVVKFFDGDTDALITDPARLEKIQKCIYYDPNFKMVAPPAVIPGVTPPGPVPVSSQYVGSYNLLLRKDYSDAPVGSLYHYTEAALDALANAKTVDRWYNKNDFVLNATKSSPGIYYLEYLRGGSNPIFIEGDKAVLFTSVVFPSDWNQYDMKDVGNFRIEMEVQAIQTHGFGTQATAFAKLDEMAALKGVKGDKARPGMLVGYGQDSTP